MKEIYITKQVLSHHVPWLRCTLLQGLGFVLLGQQLLCLCKFLFLRFHPPMPLLAEIENLKSFI